MPCENAPYLYGRNMIWPVVAERYHESFDHARQQHFTDHYLMTVNHALEEQAEEAPVLKLDHLERLTDETGMFQHAVFSVPNYNEGYTTDDNARALIVSVQLEEEKNLSTDQRRVTHIQELGNRYLAFLWHAFNPEQKRFRNFMSYDRRWLEEVGSEDSHGRSLWALGTVIAVPSGRACREWPDGYLKLPCLLWQTLLVRVAWAFSLLGMNQYLRRYPGDRAVLTIQNTLIQKILTEFKENRGVDWPWLEDMVTYCNPVLPQVLLRYGQSNNDSEALEIGLESLTWLVKIQQSENGWIMPIGNQGFYQRGGQISYFDQQPVEVYSLLSACLDAYRVTKDPAWYDHATYAFEWFFGRNALGVSVYDKVTGGCRDGLHIDRLNENQGAESTLSFIQSLLEMQQLEERTRLNSETMERNLLSARLSRTQRLTKKFFARRIDKSGIHLLFL